MILRCQPGGLHLPVWGGHSCPPLLTLGFLCRRASCLWFQIGFASPNFESRSQSRRTKSVRPTQACSSHIGVSALHQCSSVTDKTAGIRMLEESFDHVLRSQDSLEEKLEYLRQNPVRRGLARRPEDYPWLWIDPCGADTPVRRL